MDNPDFPQTETQWAKKQIYNKGINRINALQQNEIKLSSIVSNEHSRVDELKEIKTYIFRIDADTPELQKAVKIELDNLKIKFPDYNFETKFGSKE